MTNESIIGYWKRGNSQYWHITDKGAVLINCSEKEHHYDGDAHIFFTANDSTIKYHDGRIAITKAEFDKVKKLHIKRLNQY